MSGCSGIINLYKPKGMTSHDCVKAVRRILATRLVGHMGTLDPQGEGVLLIGVGRCTRLFDYFLSKDKEYEAEFTFGYTTDTLDGDGQVTESDGRIPTLREIEAVLPILTGTIDQVPPAYSAKSVGGVRAYELARKGVDFVLKPKTVSIYSIEIIAYEPPKLRVLVHCSSGTYIRSICRDLAVELGTLATMTAIKRTRAGAYYADSAVTIEELERKGEESLISPGDALSPIERFEASDEFYGKLSNGVKTNIGAPEGLSVLYCMGELFGLADTTDGVTKLIINLRY